MRNIDMTKKKMILICLFFSFFLIGTILMFITPIGVKSTYGKTVRTTDGVTITFNVFEPSRGGSNKKAIILGHGVMSNKEMLKGFAVEFAAAGFVAIPFDFRGHGQSTGDHTRGSLTNDIDAIISYLNTRSDIDTSNLAYFGFSMGGLGQEVVNESTDFKCFIGAGTWLNSTVRKGDSINPLNILMILGRYDELITPNDLKEVLSNYTGIADVYVNKLYGSFESGNATKIYLDDLTNHVLGNWDPDFIMEAREFLASTFPDVRPVDENYVVNTRLLILSLQLFGGFGFFVLIVDPLSKLVLKPKKIEDVFKLELGIDDSITLLGLKTFGFSVALGILGILIFVPIMLILFLSVAGFVSTLLFGQAFGILVLLWRMGKKGKIRLRDSIKKPFKTSRDDIIRQFLLGGILSVILFLIIYLSGGLNYMGMIPGITKIPWVLVFFLINFIIFIIYGILFHGVIQNKFDEGFKPLVKASTMIFLLQFLFWFTYLFIISLAMGSFFYFGSFLPLAIPMFLLISFLSTLIYKKSGNVIAGALVNTLFFTLLICTTSPYQSGLSFLMSFFF